MVIKLIEFANTRKEEIQKLRNISDILREHIMSIYYWRDYNCINHWEGEIFGFLPVMKTLKSGNKTLSEKLIYENLFTDWAQDFKYVGDTYVERIMDKETDLPKITNMDLDNIYKFMEEFYKDVSHELYTNKTIRKSVLYNIINKLLKKYPYKLLN